MTNGARKVVLVVDADQRFTDATRSLLHPYPTLTARDLDEAREVVLGGGVDVIVLGAGFASERSIEATRALRAADPTADVVLAADIVTNRLLKAALRAGFTDVLDLPLTMDALATILTVDSSQTRDPDRVEELDLVLEQEPWSPDREPPPIDAALDAESFFPCAETTGAGDISTPSDFEVDTLEPVPTADDIPWAAVPVDQEEAAEVPDRPDPAGSDELESDPSPSRRDLSVPPVWRDEEREPAVVPGGDAGGSALEAASGLG